MGEGVSKEKRLWSVLPAAIGHRILRGGDLLGDAGELVEVERLVSSGCGWLRGTPAPARSLHPREEHDAPRQPARGRGASGKPLAPPARHHDVAEDEVEGRAAEAGEPLVDPRRDAT